MPGLKAFSFFRAFERGPGVCAHWGHPLDSSDCVSPWGMGRSLPPYEEKAPGAALVYNLKLETRNSLERIDHMGEHQTRDKPGKGTKRTHRFLPAHR